MVILLDGASAIVRATIAEKAVAAHPLWQHLALEAIQGASGNAEERAFHLQLIRRCADELHRENMHLLLTLPGETAQYREIGQALKPDCLTIHIGDATDGAYDRFIDPRATVFDAVRSLGSFMEHLPPS